MPADSPTPRGEIHDPDPDGNHTPEQPWERGEHTLTADCWCGPTVEHVVGAADTETSRPPEDFFTDAATGALDAAYRRGWNDGIDHATEASKQKSEEAPR
jgi:hypothetical protein